MKHIPFAQRLKELRAKVHDEAHYSELTFRRDRPILWWMTLIGPIVVTLTALGVVAAWSNVATMWKLVGTSVFSFFVAGKFVILGGAESEHFFSTGELFALVVYMDMMTAFLVVFHSGFLFRLPKIGPAMLDLVEHGQLFMSTNPWVRRATFIGLVLFVAFPLTGTGAIGGAIFARLLGMSRLSALWSILLGSVLGCGIMYFGAELINRYLAGPFAKIGGVVVILGLVWLLNVRYQVMKRSYLQDEQD